MKRKRYLILFGIFISLSGYPQVQSDSLDLYLMNLEDLMKVRVTTASKSNESIKDAPAIVSVITKKEIENYGAISLYEILDRLTSTYVVGTTVAPNGMVSIRGKQTDHFNTNVLILLDGRPFRESFQGGYNGVLYSLFPVSSISKIEVMRGPGSVLYGTNAYTGVINIITNQEEKGVTALVRYGSFNTWQGVISVSKKIKDLQITADVNLLNSDGWDFNAIDERNRRDTVKYYEKGIGSHVGLKYKGLTVNTFYGKSEMNGMGRTPVWTTPAEYTISNNRLFIVAGYNFQFSKAWKSSVNATHNRMTFTNSRPGFKDNLTYRFASDLLVEWTNYVKPAENINLVFGGLANYQTGEATQPELRSDSYGFDVSTSKNPDPWIVVEPYQQMWYSAYLQADYSPTQWLKVIGGGQLNKITGLKVDFVPRLGAIFTINESWSLKTLYGQAFRSPTGFERGAKSPPSVYGYAGLVPEKISTYEANLLLSKSKFEISAAYFRTFEKNLITRSATSDSLVVELYRGQLTALQRYINKGNLTTNGFEFEGKAFLGKSFSFLTSFTYQSSFDENGNKDIYGMPKTMAKIGVNYSSAWGLNIGLFNSYFGKGGDITIYNAEGVATTQNVNPEAKPYQYMTLNVGLNIKELLKLTNSPAISLKGYVKNVLDEQIYYPEVVRRNINSLPGRPGRSFYVALQARF